MPRWFIKGSQWFENVRKVTLVGEFKVGKTADENILHGIIRFGRADAKASIFVSVRDLSFRNHRLSGFMTLSWLIREAVRGAPRPVMAGGLDKYLISSWRRTKRVEWMDVKNTRYIPSDDYEEKTVRTAVSKKKTAVEITKVLNEFESVDKLVAHVKNIYTEGIQELHNIMMVTEKDWDRQSVAYRRLPPIGGSNTATQKQRADTCADQMAKVLVQLECVRRERCLK